MRALLLLLIVPCVSFAAEQTFTLLNGNSIVGVLVKDTGDILTVRVKDGMVRIDKVSLVKIETVQPKRMDERTELHKLTPLTKEESDTLLSRMKFSKDKDEEMPKTSEPKTGRAVMDSKDFPKPKWTMAEGLIMYSKMSNDEKRAALAQIKADEKEAAQKEENDKQAQETAEKELKEAQERHVTPVSSEF